LYQAVAVCGSIVAWLRYGDVYSASTDLRGRRQRATRIADLARLRQVLRANALPERRHDGRVGGLAPLASIPLDLQRLRRLVGAPPIVRDDCDVGIGLHHALHAAHLPGRRRIDRLHLALEDGALDDRGVQHLRQLHVDAEYGLPGDLVHDLEARQRLADHLPVFRIAQLHVLRRLELRCGLRELAVRKRLVLVAHDAVRRNALRRRRLPPRRRGGDQHLARLRARFADVLLRAAQPRASRGGHRAPDALPLRVLVGRDVFPRCLREIAFQLLGQELDQARERPLPHLGTGEAHHDAVVGINDDPVGDLGGGMSARDRLGEREFESDAARQRRGSLQEGAALHAFSFAAAWIASFTRA
jgi:hypothetical protein